MFPSPHQSIEQDLKDTKAIAEKGCLGCGIGGILAILAIVIIFQWASQHNLL